MSTLFLIDKILDSPSKIGILRVLSSGLGFKGTGSEIARLAGFSVPATHESLPVHQGGPFAHTGDTRSDPRALAHSNGRRSGQD